uniref:U2A'/phosphoprotein 32 family A C-terminal domain-containing protein n=1 Tax=Glossina austeni TaxID=7395 RepID=A0A1A9V180_GLOAU
MLTNLNMLELGDNKIKKIENIDSLANLIRLEELWLSNNSIDNWKNMKVLKENKTLKTVYLEHNPVADEAMYRLKLRDIAPWLEKIDATLCR